jgi:PAS domain S-box-containing protein
MGLRWKLALPPAFVALAFVVLALASASGLSGWARAWEAVIAAIAVAIAAWFAAERLVLQPLARLLRTEAAAPPQPGSTADEVSGLAQALSALRARAESTLQQLHSAAEESRRVKQQLQTSEERYALAMRASNDGLWEWDIKAEHLYLSPRWKAMLGFGDDELANSIDSWQARLHAEDRGKVQAALDAHLANHTARFESEHRLVHKDGSARWVLSRGIALHHANGKPYRVLGLDTDISTIKRVEQMLLHVAHGTANVTGEAFFRSLVQHFCAAIGVRRAFVSECVDRPATRVRMLAHWDLGALKENKELELAGLPCNETIHSGKICFHPASLQEIFPREKGTSWHSYLGIPIVGREGMVIGHIAFFDDKPMDRGILAEPIYEIFAARAAAEIERTQMLARRSV